MTKPLWAPWRLEYIKQADEQEGCVFCDESAGALDPEESLLVLRGEAAIALLNKYPYSSGHLMVAPRRHVGELAELGDDEALEIHRLAVEAVETLSARLRTWQASTSAGTSGTSPVRASPTTSTCTSSRAGPATRTSCPCSPT